MIDIVKGHQSIENIEPLYFLDHVSIRMHLIFDSKSRSSSNLPNMYSENSPKISRGIMQIVDFQLYILPVCQSIGIFNNAIIFDFLFNSSQSPMLPRKLPVAFHLEYLTIMVLDVDVWHMWTIRDHFCLQNTCISIAITRPPVGLESCVLLVIIAQSARALWLSECLHIMLLLHKCCVLRRICCRCAEIVRGWVRVGVVNWLV